MKKILCAATAVLIMFSLSFSVFGISNVEYVTPETDTGYSGAKEAYSYLEITSGTAYCRGVAKSKPIKTSKITMTVYLEKKDGVWWRTIARRTKVVSTTSDFLSFKWGDLESGTYRTRTSVKVYNITSYESFQDVSSAVIVV